MQEIFLLKLVESSAKHSNCPAGIDAILRRDNLGMRDSFDLIGMAL